MLYLRDSSAALRMTIVDGVKIYDLRTVTWHNSSKNRQRSSTTRMSVQFSTPLERLEDGMKHHVLVIPEEIADIFEEKKVKRVVVKIEGQEYRRAIQGKKDGRRIIVLGQQILKECNLQIGEVVKITMREDDDPNYVETGEELAEVLAQDDEARARWETFTVGMQRSLALYVTQAKRSDTRIKRALELAEKMRTNTLYGDR
ncbi:MAG: YdeI/OmpD-associated family protein [Candidatus Kapaibacterium sp.]